MVFHTTSKLVKSLVSLYETPSYKSSLNEKNAMNELEISKNGPSDFRAEKLLVVEMDKYWEKNRDNGISHGNQLRP